MRLAALFRRSPSPNEDREGAVMVVLGSYKEGQAATWDEKVLRIVAADLQCRAHQRDFPPDKKCESGLVTVTSHQFQYSGMWVVGFAFFSSHFVSLESVFCGNSLNFIWYGLW